MLLVKSRCIINSSRVVRSNMGVGDYRPSACGSSSVHKSATYASNKVAGLPQLLDS